jgi:ATP-dependent RNA helicase SUPV3L1/SUV3
MLDGAVVDEVQMLADPCRGWAWTQALVGMPARTVMMTGSPDAVALVEAVAAITGEPLEVRYRERKSPLVPAKRPVDIDSIGPGDAVVAFSRRAAMGLRDVVQAAGHEVAMVYGNLSPDVRRAEAARFRSGAAAVLVATDAIGMGLNLPVRRVVFSALEKFDGQSVRPLTDGEIRQVAGRAGRFGVGAGGEGTCAVLRGLDPGRLAEALAAVPGSREGARLFVRPTQEAVLSTAQALDTPSLATVLRYLRDHMVDARSDLSVCDLTDEILLADLLDRTALPIADKFAYALLPLPPRDPGVAPMVTEWAVLHSTGHACRRPTDRCEDLFATELLAKRLTAYLWMAHRYPEVFVGRGGVRPRGGGPAHRILPAGQSLAAGQGVRSPRGLPRLRRPGRNPFTLP